MRASLKRQAVSLFMARGVAFVIATLTPMILVRVLSTDDYGTYRQALFVGSVVLELVQLRLIKSLYYFYPREQSRQSNLFSQTLTLMLILGAVGSGVLYLLTHKGTLLPSGLTPHLILPVVLYVFFENIGFLLEHVLILEKRTPLVFAVVTGSAVARIGAVLGAYLMWRSLSAMLWSIAGLAILRALALLGHLAWHYRVRFGFGDRDLLRRQFQFVMPLVLSALVGLISTKIDKAMISGMMPASQFAIYTIGQFGMLHALTILFTSIGDICLQRFSEFAARGETHRMQLLWHKMVGTNTLITLPILCFAYVFAEEMITLLFTAQYLDSLPVWRINLLFLPMQMTGYGYIPTAAGRTRQIFWTYVVRCIVVIPLTYGLIRTFGLAGGALSFVGGYWISGLLQLVIAKNVLGCTWAQFMPWQRMFGVGLTSLVVALAVSFLGRLDMGPIWTLLAALPLYFGTLLGLFYWRGYLDVAEIRSLIKRDAPSETPAPIEG